MMTGDYHGSIFLAVRFLMFRCQNSNFKIVSAVWFENCTLDNCLFNGNPSAPTLLNGCALIDTSTTGVVFDGANLSNTVCINSGPVGTLQTIVGCSLVGTLFSSAQVQVITSGYSITPLDCNTLLSVSTAAITLTLASPATLSSTWVVNIKNVSSGVVTVDPSGASTIDSVSGAVALAWQVPGCVC